MAKIDENFYVKEGESLDSYNARIAKYRGSSTPSKEDPFISALESKLMSQSDMISSSNSGIEDKINQAIRGVQSSSRSSAAAIESSFGRDIGYRIEQGETARTGVKEGSSGYATNTALLRLMDERTDKDIRDLEQRKQELILQGDAQAASKVADLQLQGLQFKQQAQQQVFQNLLSLGSFGFQKSQLGLQEKQFGLQEKQFGLQEHAQMFNEKQAVAQVALQFGLPIQEGETIDSITTRAAPMASERQRLELDQIRSSINANNAQIASARAALDSNKPLSASDLEVLGQFAAQNPSAAYNFAKNLPQAIQIAGAAAKAELKNFGIRTQQNLDSGVSKNQMVAQAKEQFQNSPAQLASALNTIESVYKNAPAPKSFMQELQGGLSDLEKLIVGR